MTRRLAAIAIAIAVLCAAPGCSLGDDDEPKRPELQSPPRGESGEPRAGEPPEARTIRAWSSSVNRGDYVAAASFFAPGAIVEQAREFRLRDRRAAIAFNRSLPCRARVTDVADDGATVLAAFTLRDGPGGRCDGGKARVRFRFRGGKFIEWRQLPESQGPQGQVA